MTPFGGSGGGLPGTRGGRGRLGRLHGYVILIHVYNIYYTPNVTLATLVLQ